MRIASTSHQDTTGGYILLYVILAVMLFSLLGSGVLISTVREIEISAQELASLEARFAAESGLECVLYWQKSIYPPPFHTNSPASVVDCGTLITPESFATQFLSGGGTMCVDYDGYDFWIGPFEEANDACANVHVTITAETTAGFENLCFTAIQSHGYSDCSNKGGAGGTPDAQRTLWYEF